MEEEKIYGPVEDGQNRIEEQKTGKGQLILAGEPDTSSFGVCRGRCSGKGGGTRLAINKKGFLNRTAEVSSATKNAGQKKRGIEEGHLTRNRERALHRPPLEHT